MKPHQAASAAFYELEFLLRGSQAAIRSAKKRAEIGASASRTWLRRWNEFDIRAIGHGPIESLRHKRQNPSYEIFPLARHSSRYKHLTAGDWILPQVTAAVQHRPSIVPD